MERKTPGFIPHYKFIGSEITEANICDVIAHAMAQRRSVHISMTRGVRDVFSFLKADWTHFHGCPLTWVDGDQAAVEIFVGKAPC